MKSLNALKTYQDYENSLMELGVDIWERDEICNLLSSYVELLSYAIEEKQEDLDTCAGTDLEYFIYNTDFGVRADDYYMIEEDGTEVKWHNAEEFWDYITRDNKVK